MPDKKPTTRAGNLLGVDLSTIVKVCKKCGKEQPGTEFWKKRRKTKSGEVLYLDAWCKSCCNSETQKSRRAEANKRRWKEYGFRNHLSTRYSITEEEYSSLLSHQGGGCAICGAYLSDEKSKKRLAVDHNHETGMVRGLLCANCNNGLGRFKDDRVLLKSAIEYLERQDAR